MIENFGKPSKKILILIALAIVTIITISINKLYKSDAPTQKIEQVRKIEQKPAPKIDQALGDTDNDGLADWQEILTGTDIKKADSDGDGTSDGSELKLGRNPTIPGPNDQDSNAMFATTTKSSEPESVSDTVARNLFANAVYMSNSGEITEESKQSLVNDLISGIQKSFTFKEYPANGLVTITDENQDKLRFYASSFATLQVGMILQMQKNISKIESDMGVLGEIYSKQASDLYALQVPASIKDIHLQIVNNYSKGEAVFEAVANEKKDPMKLPFAMKVYQEIIVAQPALVRQIAQYIKNNGIIFTSNEVGGYWNASEQQ